MNNTINVKMPKELQEYMWFRYLPESTYKTYILVGAIRDENLNGLEAIQKILNTDLKGGMEPEKITKDKRQILSKIGVKYPESRQDDLDILIRYNLIKLDKDNDGNIIYVYTNPVPRPEEILNLDEEEKNNLNNIRFELNHQHDINAVLSFILDSNSRLSATLEHIHNTTEVSHSDIKLVLEFLAKEGSINVTTDKPIDDLRKEDKVYISINKEIFEEKRFVIE